MRPDIQLLASALAESTDCYRRILDYLQYMKGEIGVASDVQLQAMAESLSHLQTQAREIDETFQGGLNKETVQNEDLSPLWVKREGLIEEIFLLNSEMLKKAMDAKTVLAHELGMLRNGQTALSGYKPQQSGGGRIVNSTS